MKYHTVNIYYNGDVDNELVNVSQGDGDVVVWRNPHHYDFTLLFSKSPFANGATSITVPSRSDKASAVLSSSAQPGDVYLYTIASVELEMSADPGIKIKP